MVDDFLSGRGQRRFRKKVLFGDDPNSAGGADSSSGMTDNEPPIVDGLGSISLESLPMRSADAEDFEPAMETQSPPPYEPARDAVLARETPVAAAAAPETHPPAIPEHGQTVTEGSSHFDALSSAAAEPEAAVDVAPSMSESWAGENVEAPAPSAATSEAAANAPSSDSATIQTAAGEAPSDHHPGRDAAPGNEPPGVESPSGTDAPEGDAWGLAMQLDEPVVDESLFSWAQPAAPESNSEGRSTATVGAPEPKTTRDGGQEASRQPEQAENNLWLWEPEHPGDSAPPMPEVSLGDAWDQARLRAMVAPESRDGDGASMAPPPLIEEPAARAVTEEAPAAAPRPIAAAPSDAAVPAADKDAPAAVSRTGAGLSRSEAIAARAARSSAVSGAKAHTANVAPRPAPLPPQKQAEATKPMGEIYGYWLRIKNGRRYPTPADFDSDKVAANWPNSMLLTCGADRPGGNLGFSKVLRFGDAATNGQIKFSSMVTQWILTIGGEAALAGAPVEDTEVFRLPEGAVSYKIVALPLSEQQGRVDHVLCHLKRS